MASLWNLKDDINEPIYETESAYDPAIPLCTASIEKKTVTWAVRQEKGNVLDGNKRVTGP